jgi:hypothetical protein
MRPDENTWWREYSGSWDRPLPVFLCQEMRTYWKTPDYRFEPKDSNKPVILVLAKDTCAHDNRQFRFTNKEPFWAAPLLEVICHHMSWAKSDAKIKEKIQSFSHASAISQDWYNNVWLKWEPGSQIKVRAYGNEPSIAIYDPAPQEIKDLINNNI